MRKGRGGVDVEAEAGAEAGDGGAEHRGLVSNGGGAAAASGECGGLDLWGEN